MQTQRSAVQPKTGFVTRPSLMWNAEENVLIRTSTGFSIEKRELSKCFMRGTCSSIFGHA